MSPKYSTASTSAIPITSNASASADPSSLYSHPSPSHVMMMPKLRIPVMNVTQAETSNSKSSSSSANMSSNLSSSSAYNPQNLQNIQLTIIRQKNNVNFSFDVRNQDSEAEPEDTKDVTMIDRKKNCSENTDNSASTTSITNECRVSVIKMLGNKSSCDKQVTVKDTTIEVNDGKPNILEKDEKVDGIPIVPCTDSHMILEYIHKKFGKGKHNKNSVSAADKIDKSTEWDANFIQPSSCIQSIENRSVRKHSELLEKYLISRKRKSVIVQNNKSKLTRKYEHSGDNFWDKRCELEDGKVVQVKLDIDLPVMNTLATRTLIAEEGCFLDGLKDTFETTWNEISLGEEIVKDYINFCQNRKHFKLEFFLLSNRQFRYAIFVCTIQSYIR